MIKGYNHRRKNRNQDTRLYHRKILLQNALDQKPSYARNYEDVFDNNASRKVYDWTDESYLEKFMARIH